MARLCPLGVAPLFIVTLATACTFNPGPPQGSITGSGAGGSTTTGGGGRGGSAGATIGPGSAGDIGTSSDACDQITAMTKTVPGDLLLILDKSASMNNQFSDVACPRGTTCVTKWPSMTTALDTVVMNTQGQINWGLKYFSNDGACGAAGPAEIAPAPNNAASIAASIAMTNPGGSTPTRFAIEAGSAYLNALTDGNPKYILLATDGEPNCCTTAGGATCPTRTGAGGAALADDANAITAIAAAYGGGAGIPVFVVGVGSLGTAVATLNSMAMAGGKAQPPDAMGRVYYPADDAAGLEAALASISGQIKSCTFALDSVPPIPNNVVVLGDGKRIAPDPVNGWSYGPGMMSIVVNGTTCDQVKAGAIQQVQAIFGCLNTPIIVP